MRARPDRARDRGEVFALAPGDAVVFRGDQRHSCRNPGDLAAFAYSVVAIAPASPLP